MRTRLLFAIALCCGLAFSGCEEEDDPTDNGVAANTLIAGGTSIPMASVVCGEIGSGNDLTLTASDVSQNNLLEIRFHIERPTATTTIALSPSGSSSEAWGTYTVNGHLEYEIQSGTATITPGSNNSLTITFNNAVAETNNDVSISLSFNGTCN
jgi:hypothetical protein